MTENNEGRPCQLKGDLGGSFSDADSGFDDPGVITIPVVRTVFRNGSDGRKISTISTEWISIQRKNETDEIVRCGRLQSPNESRKSSGGRQGVSNQTCGDDNSGEDLDQLSSSSEFLNGQNASPEPTFKMTSQDAEDFEVSRFQKEHKIEDEREKRLRFLSAPRDGRGRPIPIIRDVHTSHNIALKEETMKRVPRRRFRSKSADGRRLKGAQNLFSPTYSKVLSPETMRKRKIWADVLKKDCILEEEYYKVPYEECNKEIILGRYCTPETLLYNFRRLKKQRSSGNISDNEIDLNEKKHPTNIELTSNSAKKIQEKNYEDEKYVKSLVYGTIGKVEPFEMFKCKEDFTTTLLFQKTQTTTDQIQQLINDLNHIAFSDLKTDFEKRNYTDVYRNDSELTYIVPRYNSIKDFNDDVSGSLISQMPNLTGGDHEEIVESQTKQGNKIKTKKKVSFSNENEELVYDSNFSDSESSVFEDKNEIAFVPLSPNENKDCLLQSHRQPQSHESFVINAHEPHDFRSLTSGEDITKNNLKSLNSHTNDNINAKSSRGRYDKPFSSSQVTHLLTAQNSHKLVNDKERETLNKQFYPKDKVIKKDFPVIKETVLTPLSDSLFSQDTPFYNNLPNETQKENVNKKKKKTNQTNGNFRRDKINIYMTKGPSFAEHEIHFSTRASTRNPNVSISRIRVPLSTIRDQWQWALYLQQQARKNKESCSRHTPSPRCYSPAPSPHVVAPSPTPSYESATSLSGNSSTTSGCSAELYSPPLSPFTKNKGIFPTSL